MDGETKEDFHGLMRLAEFRNSRVANRRDHEWKVTIGLWTLLALGMIKKLPIPAMGPHQWPIWPVLGAVVFIHWAFWMRSHWAESNADIQASFFYTDRAHNRVVRDQTVNDKPFNHCGPWYISCCTRYFGFLGEPKCWAQMVTTAALASGMALIYW